MTPPAEPRTLKAPNRTVRMSGELALKLAEIAHASRYAGSGHKNAHDDDVKAFIDAYIPTETTPHD